MWKTFNRGRQERKWREEKKEGSAVQPVSYVKGGGRSDVDPQNNSRGSCRLLTLRLKWSTPAEREREERREGDRGKGGEQGSKGSMGRPGKLSVASINCAARCCHRRCVAAASATADGAALRGNYNTRVCGACLDNWTTGWIANKIGNRNQKQKENQTKKNRKPKAEKPILKLNLGNRFGGPFCPHVCFWTVLIPYSAWGSQ